MKIFQDLDGCLVAFGHRVVQIDNAIKSLKNDGLGFKDITPEDIKANLSDISMSRNDIEAHLSRMGTKQLWGTVGKYGENFWTDLAWEDDGKELWEYVAPYNPTILTGISMDKRCAPEKRIWCSRELGDHVDVITCWARDKVPEALKRVKHLGEALLIDDKQKNVDTWLANGGPAILHTSAADTIEQLQMYL